MRDDEAGGRSILRAALPRQQLIVSHGSMMLARARRYRTRIPFAASRLATAECRAEMA